MKEIIGYLMAIQKIAKGIHYKVHGYNFYGDHLLCDRIVDNLDGFIDDIFENYFLGHEEEAPQQREIVEISLKNIPLIGDDIEEDFRLLDDLIFKCIGQIQLMPTDELTAGDSDLLGRICSDLQKKH